MPSQSRSKSIAINEANFVLKHRIAGAGFLLFFGALLLPWLLGPPSQAVKPDVSAVLTPDISKSPEENIVDPIDLEIPVEAQEQVYISKITPLDAATAKNNSSSTSNALDTTSQSSTKADEPSKRTTTQSKPKPTSAATKKAPETKKPAVVSASNPTVKSSSTQAANGSAKTSNNDSSRVNEKAADKAEIEVGWIVQVGVFTDKRSVAKVIKDLRTKGFDPSSTIVDTNRGKATGTRIWLGPYSQRVEAAKAKSQFTSKTGEAGFIRAYP